MVITLEEVLVQELKGLREDVQSMTGNIREMSTKMQQLHENQELFKTYADRIKDIEVQLRESKESRSRNMVVMGIMTTVLVFLMNFIASHWK